MCDKCSFTANPIDMGCTTHWSSSTWKCSQESRDHVAVDWSQQKTHCGKRQLENCLHVPIATNAFKAPHQQSCAILKSFCYVWHKRASWCPLAQNVCVSNAWLDELSSLKGGTTAVWSQIMHQPVWQCVGKDCLILVSSSEKIQSHCTKHWPLTPSNTHS